LRESPYFAVHKGIAIGFVKAIGFRNKPKRTIFYFWCGDPFYADRIGDAPVQSTVHLRTATLRLLMQRRESRQHEAASDRLLDAYNYDVGQIFHPCRRQPYRCREHCLPALIETQHPEVLANDLHVASPRTGLVVFLRGLWDDQHPLIVANVFNDATGHVPESDEVAEPLKRLKQDQKAQPRCLSLASTASQLQLGLRRRVKIGQLAVAHTAL
jgi:hypothetical protein